jgi:tetratricopeptide (TPR) repeat protein
MIRPLLTSAFLTLAFASTTLTPSLSAQSAADEVAAGDEAFKARNAPEALQHYEKALALDPKNYAALWQASQTAVDLGEFDPNADHRTALYKTAEQRARLAVQVNPNDANGHFALAKALGRTALTLGKRDRIKYAKDVRDQALACLAIDPKHAGCLHVMGVWNAEVMRLNGFTRMIAKNFLGGAVFDQASWPEAQRYMVAAVTNDPRRIIHRLDLGRIYADMNRKADAKTQFELAIKGPLIDYNDPHYKTQAEAALKDL